MEPVAAGQIMQAVIAGAVVILTGALYALLFAFGRLQHSRLLLALAFVAYGALSGAVFVLAAALNLTGVWIWLVAAMLLGYLLAPWGIWYLCTGTHRGAVAVDRPPRGIDTAH